MDHDTHATRDEDFLDVPEDRGGTARSTPRRRRWRGRALALAGAVVLVGGGASALAVGTGTGSDGTAAAAGTTTGAAASPAEPASPTSPAAPAPVEDDDGPGVLDRWLGGDDHDDHDGDHDGGRWDDDDDDDDDDRKLRGTLAAVDGSTLTVTTSSGDAVLDVDGGTEVIRDHGHVDLDELVAGQDVVVVQGPQDLASKVIVLG